MRAFAYQIICFIAEVVISFVKGSPCMIVPNQWVESWAAENNKLKDRIEELEEHPFDLSTVTSGTVQASEVVEPQAAEEPIDNFSGEMSRLLRDLNNSIIRRTTADRNDGMPINDNDPTWKQS